MAFRVVCECSKRAWSSKVVDNLGRARADGAAEQVIVIGESPALGLFMLNDVSAPLASYFGSEVEAFL